MLFARAHEVIERQARIPMAILDDSGSRSVQGQTLHFDPAPLTSGQSINGHTQRRLWHVSKVPGAETFTALRKAATRSAETICVTIGEILRALTPPNAPTISETQAMPNPKSIML